MFISCEVIAEDEPSFYGQRSVIAPTTTSQQPTTFHRRVIAPPINSDIDDELELIISPEPALKELIPLSRNELLLAKKAQYYFQRNVREETGLWDSVQGYPHLTMWDVASGIAATLAMEKLGLKTQRETHYDLKKTLNTLLELPLYKDQLPNREYSTKSGKPSGRLSNTASNGSGWSALDIGRLLIWLKIVCQEHPHLIEEVSSIISRWNLDKAVNKGTLYGTNLSRGKEHYRQEGRNGYLQYAARGFELFNHPVELPDLNRYLETVSIDGVEIEIDNRNVPFLTSDPYVLASIEYGNDSAWSQIDAIYQLHKYNWSINGKLSAFAEDAMNKNPWFAYNNIYYYGKAWTSVSPSGKVIENPQIFSHKVAFGFSTLFDDDYSEALYQQVLSSSRQYRSIPTGLYMDGGSNAAFNINTNSMILVALWFKSKGNTPILNQ